MTMKSLATAVAAVAAIGAATSAVSYLTAQAPAAAQAPTTVFFAPLPLDPAAAVPAPEQLASVLNTLADPGVPAAGKSDLVEGGLGPAESGVIDHKLQKALKKGALPLSISVANVIPTGPGAASADVTASSPKLEPHTVNLTFVDQGGWKLSRASLLSLSQLTSG
ncbi:hypothetical protein [Mycolicibacter arupensis]|uniref:Low molecular weight antigen MTB12-like C-terminal domain-containing protein n=1 Tax=Mycolicibacter arupensis TaxID=342002 RepID=A0A0F5MYV8_9MYCO|nr:hypothetical protein [Mycolicibacter arupensis]KKB99891.1 hypothetical protein WR43_07380 [Mycolicibacter arupensis]MCV7277595.1 hypothetical protein [Mycolicibacter arupensis]ORA00049.1 hypothetical protein BST15_06175 [Mycolicibacter arupensis]